MMTEVNRVYQKNKDLERERESERWGRRRRMGL
jgi:hypothetical protein